MARFPNLKMRCGAFVTAVTKSSRGFDLTVEIDGSATRVSCDAVVNCSYADINRLTSQLGYPVQERQFEYTVVPIIEAELPPIGVTIMDGPFMTLFPFGPSQFLLVLGFPLGIGGASNE